MGTYINSIQLAGVLASVQGMVPRGPLTGGRLAQLDEQVLSLLDVFPQLRAAYLAFSKARVQVLPATFTIERWKALQQAADELANEVSTLGDINIALCERSTPDGTCRNALAPDGRCLKNWHTDGPPRR